MSKYLVTDNDIIELKMYVDARSSKLKVYSEEEAKLLNDKLISEIEVKLSTLSVDGEDEEKKKEIEKLQKEIEALKEKGYPSYLNEETTWWGIPDGIADEYINEKGFKRDGRNPQAQFNSTEYNKAFIAILLKRWTLDKEDTRLKLIFETIPGFTNRKRIEGSCLENVCSLRTPLYRFITTHAYAKIFGEDKELKN